MQTMIDEKKNPNIDPKTTRQNFRARVSERKGCGLDCGFIVF